MIKRYVLEGAANSGKTTLLHLLGKKGFQVCPEIATEIIEREQNIKGELLPWINRIAFDQECLKQLIERYDSINHGIVFFDRAFTTNLAYHKMYGSCPECLEIIDKFHYDKIFLLERLPNYKKDKIRRFDNETEDKIQSLIEKSCIELNYDLIHVPLMSSIEERIEFILKNL
ncbi:MAG: AAA family ATPase [Nanoarchaeota archaeon]|nr:AAA family ATPase [Nanoarchaeota archaeon]MBU4351508.1 AAA family ATPase [Nanoarchaeota archaeon]MBU4456190.1 AAA family ATPase [Nanoarchaeota archaeon]MCG2719944.1 AAA family ATPase [Nanoarchaeota archaeon]